MKRNIYIKIFNKNLNMWGGTCKTIRDSKTSWKLNIQETTLVTPQLQKFSETQQQWETHRDTGGMVSDLFGIEYSGSSSMWM